MKNKYYEQSYKKTKNLKTSELFSVFNSQYKSWERKGWGTRPTDSDLVYADDKPIYRKWRTPRQKVNYLSVYRYYHLTKVVRVRFKRDYTPTFCSINNVFLKKDSDWKINDGMWDCDSFTNRIGCRALFSKDSSTGYISELRHEVNSKLSKKTQKEVKYIFKNFTGLKFQRKMRELSKRIRKDLHQAIREFSIQHGFRSRTDKENEELFFTRHLGGRQ